MNIYTSLAKQSIVHYIKHNKVLDVPKKLPAPLKEKAGVFVTIYKNDELRGCIGTLFGTKNNLAKEIIDNAISSATKDPRFQKVTKEELSKLSYEVSVLEPFEQIEKIEDLDPKKYGIFIKSDNNKKSALLLPNLLGLDTVIKQLTACLRKAGIDGTKEKFSLFRFKTKRYD